MSCIVFEVVSRESTTPERYTIRRERRGGIKAVSNVMNHNYWNETGFEPVEGLEDMKCAKWDQYRPLVKLKPSDRKALNMIPLLRVIGEATFYLIGPDLFRISMFSGLFGLFGAMKTAHHLLPQVLISQRCATDGVM